MIMNKDVNSDEDVDVVTMLDNDEGDDNNAKMVIVLIFLLMCTYNGARYCLTSNYPSFLYYERLSLCYTYAK